MKSQYFISCAAASLLGGVAHAAPAVPIAAEVASDAGDAAADRATTGVNDIIVTAQRRDQSIQDVPMTLQALNGETLAQFNVATFDDLLKFTPNVTFGSNGPGAGQIFMRGLSAGVVGNQSSATIAYFPNVAIYLDDESMQFPARNADVYLADMERVEVLEGPQGTLFGGGAEAGAVRYITNKPKMNKWEGHFDAMFGGTSGGASNNAFSGTVNIPVVEDKLALRVTAYTERQGGYIDNLPSTFTRSNNDGGVSYFNVKPNAQGLCPDGKAPGASGCYLAPSQQTNGGAYDNHAIAGNDINPVTYQGLRVSALWDITPDWNLLVNESMQYLDAQGSSAQTPVGIDLRQLGPLQTELFTPSFNKDRYWSTAWTLNGEIGDWKVVYTGSYMTRHIEDQQDYANYSRTAVGTYYQCTGLNGPYWGTGTPVCYSPLGYWHDQVRSTHQSHEFRVSSPENKRIRVIGGAYYEKLKIEDVMDFHYKSIPQCTDQLLAQGTACSGLLQAYKQASLITSGLKDATTAFGEETQRGYTQYAFFGSVDFDILPNLTLTGGTRYYHYSEYQVGAQYQTYADECFDVLICNVPPANTVNNGNQDFDLYGNHVVYHGFKSRGVLTWKPSEHTMLYGLFSQGFRPGGFNRAIKFVLPDPNTTGVTNIPNKGGHPYQFQRPLQYAPDTLTNWEIGLKTDLFDHRVQLNLSAYYMIWSNTQIGFYNPAAGFGNTSFVTNGPTYHVKGIEAQVVARPVSGLTVQGAITYNNSKQTNSPCFIGQPGTSSAGSCITVQYSGGAVSASNPTGAIPVLNPFGTPGGQLPFSPEVQGSLQARYEWDMHGLKWFTTGSVTYTGPMYSEPNTYPSPPASTAQGVYGTTQYRYRQPGYALVDASLGVKKDFITAQIFVKNLTNSNASTFTSSPQFIEAQVPVRPRTFGVRLTGDF